MPKVVAKKDKRSDTITARFTASETKQLNRISNINDMPLSRLVHDLCIVAIRRELVDDVVKGYGISRGVVVDEA
jgi:hypothetical protein